jgi:hypothetical protein
MEAGYGPKTTWMIREPHLVLDCHLLIKDITFKPKTTKGKLIKIPHMTITIPSELVF